MRFRILPKIFIVASIFALLVIIQYQGQILKFMALQQERVNIYVSNFFYSGERTAPLSLLERETELKLYIGEPFKSLSPKEWDSFWQILYGAYPKDSPSPGLPKKVRQLTYDEIADALTEQYPDPFENFQESHWGMFFGVAFKKK